MDLPTLPPGTMPLTTPRQARAVASPLRLEIIEHLRHSGPASVSDLARLTGRPATALHYHVGLLHKAGLIAVAGSRRAGKRTESVYQLAAERFAVVARRTHRPLVRAGLNAVGATLRLAQREASRAVASGDLCTSGPSRNFHVRRSRAPLSGASLARANALLEELEAIFRNESKKRLRRHPGPGDAPEPGTQVVSCTFVLAPVPSRPSPKEPAP